MSLHHALHAHHAILPTAEPDPAPAAMNLRRVLLDIDKARSRPEMIEIAAAIEGVAGVQAQAVNITVQEIDIETVGMEVTVVGEYIDYDALIAAVNDTGAVVHSTDELVVGAYIVEHVARSR